MIELNMDSMPTFKEFWKDATITVLYDSAIPTSAVPTLKVQYAFEVDGKHIGFTYSRRLCGKSSTILGFAEDCFAEFEEFYKKHAKSKVNYDEFKNQYIHLRIFPSPNNYRNSYVIVEFEYNKDFRSRSKILATNRLWTLSGEDEITDMIHDLYKQACYEHPDDFGYVPGANH